MDTDNVQNNLIVGKVYLSTKHYWFLYQTKNDAKRFLKWCLFHSNAFDEVPIIDRVALTYYNKNGLTVAKEAAEENKRDAKLNAEIDFLLPQEAFMFLTQEDAQSARDRVRGHFTGKRRYYVCQVLYKEQTGWILTESLNHKTLGFERII